MAVGERTPAEASSLLLYTTDGLEVWRKVLTWKKLGNYKDDMLYYIA